MRNRAVPGSNPGGPSRMGIHPRSTMQVQVTFDTSVPSEKQKLESLFGEEALEAAELSAAAAGEGTTELTLDSDEDTWPFAVDAFEWGDSKIFLRRGEDNEKTNHGKVAEYLSGNTWASVREMSEALDITPENLNSILTSSNAGRMFVSRDPLHRDLPHGAKEWGIHPFVMGLISE